MALPRVLGALAALTGLLVACSAAAEKPAASPGPNPSNTSLDRPLPAAPAPPACGDVLASMSIRDKLAQLLMVGVTGADDARAVVDNHHVGGIMIGSWTDLSMMGAPLADIASSASPLPLAVSVDEEGGRVSRLAGLIGEQPSPRVLAQTYDTRRSSRHRVSSAARPCGASASPSTSRPSSTSRPNPTTR